MTQDKPMLGIALMLGFCLLAPVGDSIAKILGARMSVLHLVTVRFVFQAMVLVPFILLSGRILFGTSRVVKLTFLRTILHILGIWAMFTSLQYLPIADAVAIAFVMPFIMLLLGYLVLGEEIGPHRLGACVVGFIGTLLVVQPNFVDVGWPALLPMFVAVVFALFMLVTRLIAKEVDALALQASSGLMASVMLVPLVYLLQEAGVTRQFSVPIRSDIALLFLLGLVGTMAHLLMTWSLRYAPSATLAPMQYIEIPFATLIGWLVFRDLPNGLAAIGILITIIAGLYVIWRERVSTSIAAPNS